MLRTTVASLLLILVYTPCSTAAEYDEVRKASPLQQFAMDPFKESEGQIPIFFNNKSKLLDRFGMPIKEESSKFPDRTSDAMLTYYYLQYDGLSFSIVESEDQMHSWIETIEITGNSYALKYELGIGSRRSDIVTLFEPKVHAESNPMDIYAKIVGYWANAKDDLGNPVWVNSEIDISIEFDETDVVTKISLAPAPSH